jgi:hypothetical protein
MTASVPNERNLNGEIDVPTGRYDMDKVGGAGGPAPDDLKLPLDSMRSAQRREPAAFLETRPAPEDLQM